MSGAAIPVGASARVEPATRAIETPGGSSVNRGGDFSTPSSRTDSSLPANSSRAGRLTLARFRQGLGQRDQSVLDLVAEHRLASAAQIRTLHFPADAFATRETAARSCRRVLARLVRDGLLVRLERRVGGLRAGSDGHVYALGPVGYRLTHPEGRARPRYWEPTSPFVDHQLAITQLVVELRLAERRCDVNSLAIEGEPRSWRRLPGQSGRAAALRPDLHTSIEVGDVELRWFVEVDRGTAHVPAVLRKCRLYESYYRSGVEQAEHGVFPRVLWITPTQARAERLSQAITTNRRLTAELFAVTTAEHPLDALLGSGGSS